MRVWASKRSVVLSGFAVGVLALTGCGSTSATNAGGVQQLSGSSASPASDLASMSATEVLAQAKAAAKGAGSVHLLGSGTSNGSKIVFDLTIAKASQASGSVTMGVGKLNLVVTPTYVYMKADPSFWSKFGGSAFSSLVAGKWLKAPTNNASFKSFSDLGNFDSRVLSNLKPTGTFTKGTTTTFQGQPVVELKDSTGSLFVAASGTPYPVAIVQPKGKGPGTLLMTDWGRATPESAPTGADVLDLSKLRI